MLPVYNEQMSIQFKKKKSMAIAQAKEGIEKELTCPLCLDIFQDPKRLPCDHIYCKDPCIQGLVLRSQNATIICPECRTLVQVPHNDVNNLPTAFQINRFKELYQKMKENDETDSPSTPMKQKEQATCATHVSQPIALYCETCNEVLCRDCVLKSDKHKKHDYGYIDEVADKQRKQITSQLKPVRELESKLSVALENISQVKSSIAAQGQTHLDKVDSTFDAIINALREEKELLKSNISQKVQRKSNKLTNQEEELTKRLTELSNTIKKVDSIVQSQSDEDFVHSKRKLARKIQEVSQKAQGLPLQPKDAPDLDLCLTSPDEIRASYRKKSYVLTDTQLADPQKCVLESFRYLETGKQSTTTLHLRDLAGKQNTKQQDIQIELTCIRENRLIHGTVAHSTKGKQLISVTPNNRGHHVINLKVNTFHIAGSPFSVYVQKPPQQLDAPISIIQHIHGPGALFCSKDKLYVECDSKTIAVFNENRERIKTVESQVSIFEMTVDTETKRFFVTDVEHSQMHKLDKHGRLIKSVGSYGKHPGQFDCPNGLQISKNGEIFVCNTRNHRIKVYNRELELLQIFGEKGKKPGCFNVPVNLTFDESGNVFVAEQMNHRVQVLSPNGKTIRIFGKKGSNPGELKSPIGIAINGQYVYVIDNGNLRISVFTTQGQFVTTFGNGYLNHPECISVDGNGYVYVSDNSRRIVVF